MLGFYLISCLCFLTFQISAQGSLGKIVGKLAESASQRSVSGETVYLYRENNQIASAKSSRTGNFSFFSIESGEYHIKITKDGFQSYQKKIRINPNFTTKLVVYLDPLESERETQTVSVEQTVKSKKQNEPKIIPPIVTASISDVSSAEIKLSEETKIPEEKENKNREPASTEEIVSGSELDPVFYDAVDEMPVPTEGWSALMKNIVYPSDAVKLNIQGTVYLQAFINKDGEVTNILIMKSIPLLNVAAQDAVYKTKFKPGKIGNEIVDSKLTIPVPFKLK